MNPTFLFQFLPYASRLAKAATTIERLEKDPDVQDVIKLGASDDLQLFHFTTAGFVSSAASAIAGSNCAISLCMTSARKMKLPLFQ